MESALPHAQHLHGQASPFPRRSFLRQAAGVAASLAIFPAIAAEQSSAPATTPEVLAPEVQMAALGASLRASNPKQAATLEASARQVTNLASTSPVDWQHAAKAQQKLTEPKRIAKELAQGDVVFVEGWLLTHSEAGAVLLYDLASRESGPYPANIDNSLNPVKAVNAE